jgi:hypothetical protein
MINKSSILIFVIACLQACKGTSYDIFYVKNNSNLILSYDVSNRYPDTSILLDGNAGSTEIIRPGLTAGPFLYTKSHFGIVEIFLFDSNIFANTPLDTIRSRYLILKRYDLTTDSLNKMGGIITYP